MKLKEKQELKSHSRADLLKQVEEEREHLRVLQFDLAAGKVKNIREVRLARKKIATILTFLKLMTE
jgi:ribosomal protein L29